MSIRSNRVKSTTFSTHLVETRDAIFSKSLANRLPVSRIANTKDESTLVGCIGQPSHCIYTDNISIIHFLQNVKFVNKKFKATTFLSHSRYRNSMHDKQQLTLSNTIVIKFMV